MIKIFCNISELHKFSTVHLKSVQLIPSQLILNKLVQTVFLKNWHKFFLKIIKKFIE